MTPLQEAIARVRDELHCHPSARAADHARICDAAEEAEGLRADAERELAEFVQGENRELEAEIAKVVALEARLEMVIAAGNAIRDWLPIWAEPIAAWDRALTAPQGEKG